MFTSKLPSQGIPLHNFGAMIAYKNFRPEVVCPPEWKELIKQCWTENSAERPSFEDILQQILSIDCSEYYS